MGKVGSYHEQMVIEAERNYAMKTQTMNFSLIKHWSAWPPLTLSLAALTLVLAHFAIFGITHDKDEGAAAHIWQLLMAAQLPFVAYFMFKWIPSRIRESLLVLALLACTWIANFAAVFFLT